MKPGWLSALVLSLAAVSAQADPSGCRILLAPGAFAGNSTGSRLFLSSDDYFREYRAYFEGRGCEVRQAEFPPDATIEVRGLVLRDQAERYAKKAGGKLVLIAHSQAGLDSRFALRRLGLSAWVSGLVTVASPHRGTPAANWVVEHRESGSLIYRLLKWLADYDMKALAFAGELTPEFLAKHAAHFEKVPDARYAFARGACRTGCHATLRFSAWWFGLGESDGLSPLESQSLDGADDLGTFDLDHISQVGADPAKREERARLLEAIWRKLTQWESTDPRR